VRFPTFVFTEATETQRHGERLCGSVSLWRNRHMTGIQIVRATWRDAWTLSRLDRKCFQPIDAYDWLTYLGLCLWPSVVALKAASGGEIIGFVASDRRRRHGHAIIVTLSVDPAWRRRGLGERLMHECEARIDLPRVRLQVRKSNTPAIHLYLKLGYTVLGALPRYYGDSEDGYLMEKARG